MFEARRLLVLALAGGCLALAGGCQGSIVEPPPEVREEVDTVLADALDSPRIWRLSNTQYARTVDALFGSGGEIGETFLAEVSGHGFANSIDQNAIDDQRILEYQRAAQELALRAVEDPDTMARVWSCEGNFDDATCIRRFIADFGERAFRRPLLSEEQTDYEAFFVDVLGALDGPTAVQLVIETMLQSPSFQYRTEVGRLDDPEPVPGERVTLTPHESLSLLSYTLWGVAPDVDFGAAEELETREGLQLYVDRMLDDPRLLAAFEEFVEDLLDYEDLDLASPAVGYEDDWDGLRESMRGERHEFLQYLLFSGEVEATYAQLVTADYNFADARLAPLYEVAAPASGFVRIDTGGARPGLLGQVGVLAAHALPDGTSPPRRGKLVKVRLLCFPAQSPPDNVAIAEDALEGVTTTREFFEAVTGPGTCGASCHVSLNPPGFAFEHFDQVGRWRDTDRGAPVDSAVDLDPLGLGPVDGAAGLGRALAASAEAEGCFARQFYRFAMGRTENASDRPFVRDLGAELRARGGDIRALLRDLLTRESMHRRAMPEL